MLTQLISLLLVGIAAASNHERTELRMPGAVVTKPETYLCTSLEVDPAQSHYITEFETHGSMQNAHHILLFGCTVPGSDKAIWNCGEMNNGADSSSIYEQSNPCAAGSQILYAWGRDAPPLKLPEGVGFKVGGDSPHQYLVVQVHYMHAMDNDHSENFETACLIDEDVTLHPFAFRTHAHTHGKVVSGWKVQRDEEGKDHWELIGKHDPMKPQMFYPVANNEMIIEPGDVVAARCHMKNDGTEAVAIGPTGQDEMCNFYMMYWVEGGETLEDNTCVSPGPPSYYWTNQGGLNNIPDKEANKE